VVTNPTPPRQGLFGRLAQAKPAEGSPYLSSQPAPAVLQPPVAAKPVAAKPAAAPAPRPTETPRPGDYRESWGKVARSDAEPARKDPPVLVPRADPPKPKTVTTVQGPTETHYSDPSKDPGWFHQKALSSLQSKKQLASKAPDKAEVAAVPEVKPRPGMGSASVSDQPGVQSVMAARMAASMAAAQGAASSREEMANAFGNFPPMLPGRPPGPPNPYPPARPSLPAPMAQDAAVPTGMANAFTVAENSRPIPADFSPQMVEANGFSQSRDREPIVQLVAAPNGYTPPPQIPGIPSPPQGNAFAVATAPHGPVGPVGYGPMPSYGPAPFNPMMMPASQPMMPPAQAAAPSNTPQLLGLLKNSLYPSHREWAADCLSRQDWRSQPEVVQALVTAAKEDPAATVRAGCVRALAQMKANTLPVVSVLQSLKADADPRVRMEVEEALPALGAVAARQSDTTVRPASGVYPGGQ
jgi:hypothetical protein